MGKSPLILPSQFGENSRIEVQQDLNRGALVVVIEEGKQPKGYRISRENSIGCALALLTAAGTSIEEIYRRQQSLNAGKNAN